MEDVKLGWLSHWEARVMGSDVMSYGMGSGEDYVSDITLAFFVDSGQYSLRKCEEECDGANHTNCGLGMCGGGRLLGSTGEDEALAKKSLTSSLFAKFDKKNKASVEIAASQNASRTSPGYIRWGRHEVSQIVFFFCCCSNPCRSLSPLLSRSLSLSFVLNSIR